MGGCARDVIVISETGLTAYQRFWTGSVDEALLGAVLSSLHTFVRGSLREDLAAFELKEYKFHFLRRGAFIFCASCTPKTKAKKIRADLEEIADKFFRSYPETARESFLIDGDSERFLGFSDKIEECIEINERVEDFWSL
jgi:hypothetical protein